MTEAEINHKQQDVVNVELSEKLQNLCQSGFKKLVVWTGLYRNQIIITFSSFSAMIWENTTISL